MWQSKDNRTRLHPVRTAGGSFFPYCMTNQSPRSIDDQIAILKSRGMEFASECEARELLSRVSYFRLKYYWMDMVDEETGDFKAGASFESVAERYEFDRQLRLILFGAIEILEVGLRSKIISVLSLSAGNGLWYLDKSLFENLRYHEDFVLDLKYEFGRSSDPFARNFVKSHPDWDTGSLGGANPDAWLILETATFGTLSKMYKNLRAQSPLQSAIANEFGLYSSRDFSSWLEAVCLLRNVIAHHSRLWYRIFAKKPANVRSHRDKWLKDDLTENQRRRAYGLVSCLLYLCNAIKPDNGIAQQIRGLFSSHPRIPAFMLGFTGDWREQPLWR